MFDIEKRITNEQANKQQKLLEGQTITRVYRGEYKQTKRVKYISLEKKDIKERHSPQGAK